ASLFRLFCQCRCTSLKRRIARPSAWKNSCSWRMRPRRTISSRNASCHSSTARAPAELYAAVLTDLGAIAINPRDASLRDTQHAVYGIVVADDERDLLGRAQSREEAELIVVALRFTPIAMNRSDQRFCVLDAEGIDRRPILLAYTGALQRACRIEVFRMIGKAEVQRAAQRPDRVVVGLLGPAMRIGNLHELRDQEGNCALSSKPSRLSLFAELKESLSNLGEQTGRNESIAEDVWPTRKGSNTCIRPLIDVMVRHDDPISRLVQAERLGHLGWDLHSDGIVRRCRM